MSFRNQSWLAAAVIALMICIACGQIYRPVVIPVSNIPPTPGNFHAVFSLNTNAYYGLAPDPNNPGNVIPTLVYGPGSGMQIDVSGDSDLGVASLVNGTVSGANPTHGISLPNNSRVFIATAGSALTNGVDTLSSFFPASSSTTSSGISSTNVISYPNYVANPGAVDFFCPYLPDFVAASQNTTVYVANYGAENLLTQSPACNVNSTDSVAAFNASTGALSNLVYLPAGSHPVAMAQVQTLSGNKLYVANQGTSTVASFNTVDMTQNPNVAGFTGTTPVWMVARGDGQQLYLLSQGDGQLWTINTANDTVIGNISVGVGANYVLYDPNLNRLYVTNPNNSTVYIFSVVGNTPSPLSTIVLQSGSTGNYPACVNPCPMSVAALPDGTRAYIASYQLVAGAAPGCIDPGITTPTSPTSLPTCFVNPSLTVIDALSFAVKKTLSGNSVPEVANCVPAYGLIGYGPYFPGLVPVTPTPVSGPVSRFATHFRVSAVAAPDSSRVYVSVCDAGTVAIINTTDSNTNNPGSNLPADTLVLDLPTPFGTGTTSDPLPQQNPIFLLTGR
jgi:DNA-binding beta-propeller fold protein YncE